MPERLLGEPLEGWDPEERPPDQCPQVFHGNCRVRGRRCQSGCWGSHLRVGTPRRGP